MCTDGGRARVEGMMSGVDRGTGTVVVSVASTDFLAEYGFAEVSPMADEEMGSIGVPESGEDTSMGKHSANSDLEDEGETPTGRVGGTDMAVMPCHMTEEVLKNHVPPWADALDS